MPAQAGSAELPAHAPAPAPAAGSLAGHGFWRWCDNPPVRHCAWLVLIVVLVGSGYRVTQYMHSRSFWRDEAFLLPNILDKDWRQLLGRLDNEQTSPPLFLWTERTLALTFGPSELVMRALPQTAGLLALGLFALLTWRLLGPAASVWTTAWFAFSSEPVFHATSMKQYSSDLFAAITLLLLALGWRDTRSTTTRFLLTSAGAALLLWLSQPACFVFGGISLAMLYPISRRGRRHLLAWLGGNLLVGVSFAVLFWVSLRHQRVEGLVDYWREAMADYSRPWTIPLWIAEETYRLCELPYKAMGPLVLVLVALGAGSLWRRRQLQMLGVCLIPVGLTILAACVHRYPYHGGRMTLFLMPGLLIVGGAGLEWLREALPVRWRPLWWAAAAPILAVGVGEAALCVSDVWPMNRSHIRPAVEYVRAHRQSGEAVYVISEGRSPEAPGLEGGSMELLAYWRNPDPLIYRGMPAPQDIPERRFWVVFAFLPRHYDTRHPENGSRYLAGVLDDIRAGADEKASFIVKEGGAAFLFERKNKP